MKTFVLVLVLLAGAQADFFGDLWDGIQTNLLDPVVTAAQTAAQDLLDTYVPVLGQAAQQLVGDAVQQAGQALTDLVSGKRKRQLVTDLGQIIHDGITNLQQAVEQAVNGVSQSVQEGLQGLINGLGQTPGTRHIPQIGVKSKFLIKKRAKEMSIKMAKAVQKMANARGFFEDLGSAVHAHFAPAVQAAQDAFNQLTTAATATGQAILDHGSQLVSNVQGTLQQAYDDILAVAGPYYQDAQTIIAHIQAQVQSLVQ